MKRYRIMKIKEIIQNQVIETQEELAEALKKRALLLPRPPCPETLKTLC